MSDRTKRKGRDAMPSGMVGIATFLLLTACAGMTAIGAGCSAYAEARLSMPSRDALPSGAWGNWIADLDDRMTGVCR